MSTYPTQTLRVVYNAVRHNPNAPRPRSAMPRHDSSNAPAASAAVTRQAATNALRNEVIAARRLSALAVQSATTFTRLDWVYRVGKLAESSAASRLWGERCGSMNVELTLILDQIAEDVVRGDTGDRHANRLEELLAHATELLDSGHRRADAEVRAARAREVLNVVWGRSQPSPQPLPREARRRRTRSL